MRLELTTDAEDSADPVNGIPDISADGVSSCVITITKKDDNGDVVTDATDFVVLESGRGLLSTLRTQLSSGVATVTLTSVKETVTAHIRARSEENGVSIGELQIQFAPV